MRYRVKTFEVYSRILEVEADSNVEACEIVDHSIANGCYSNGNSLPSAKYEHIIHSIIDWVDWIGYQDRKIEEK